MSRLRAAATVLLISVVTAAGPAAAQEVAPDESTTTSSTSTTVVADPTASTVVEDPSATSTTLPPPPEDPAANGDAPTETVPEVDVTIPPRPVVTGGSYAGQADFSSFPGRAVRVTARSARARATETQAALDAAIARRDLLLTRRVELRGEIAELAVEEREAIEALEAAQVALEERAADAYIRGNLGETSALIMSSDAGEFAQRVALLDVVVEADELVVRTFRQAREAVDESQVDAASELADVTTQLLAAEEAVRAAELEHEFASRELAVFLAGGTLVIHGFVFPVAQPYSFGDSFGAPRMMGTEHEHWHEGTDIMAPMGTLLLACERGVIMRVGTGGVLGGNTVWLRGESGVAYYYAHLQTFAPGIVAGAVVEAGTVLGTVGDTGNARGGAPHLHFEVHPDDGDAVNPYPLLAVAEEQPQPEPIWLVAP
jgi:murein DD-endopeptidase MepM/ murein hydrolase activator NlpD